MSELNDAIKTRRSRRKYIPEVLKTVEIKKLQALIDEYNTKENLDIRLVVDNGDAFGGFRKSYGMFSGVRNYIALIGDKNDSVYLEKLGYYGELLILHATALGLGTCWVGGTFHRESCPFELSEEQSIVCVITVGRVPQGLSLKEKLIHKLTHRKTKTMEEMYKSDNDTPEWFLSGMEAVKYALSAINRQPVMFKYVKDGIVTANVENIHGEGYALDLGIAKLHFELGAGNGSWEFGNGTRFARTEK